MFFNWKLSHSSIRTVQEKKAGLAESFQEKYFTIADTYKMLGVTVVVVFQTPAVTGGYPAFVITSERGYVVTPNIMATMSFILASDVTITLPYIILFV
jgi:hypothetical protein